MRDCTRSSVVGLSIFGSVRFWIKINNQIEFFLSFWTEPKTGSNRLISVRFGSVFSLPNQFKPKLWCSSKFQIQSTPSPGNVTRPTNCKQIESNSQHHACTQISSYWGHQRLDRVHDYWIQPEAFPKATKHRRREIIK
jgi:hypothetical protein